MGIIKFSRNDFFDKLSRFLIKPAISGLFASLFFLMLTVLLKYLSLAIGTATDYKFEGSDIHLSALAFLLVFLINFLKNFNNYESSD